MCVPSQLEAAPWQASQPAPSSTWNCGPRASAAALSAWQSRHNFWLAASGSPNALAMRSAGGVCSTAKLLWCLSCFDQIRYSLPATDEPRGRFTSPWQLLALQVVTPICAPALRAAAAANPAGGCDPGAGAGAAGDGGAGEADGGAEPAAGG